jgi:tyrosinase
VAAGVGGVGLRFGPRLWAQTGGAAITTADVGVRPDIATLDPDGPEIAALKAGVAAMKARALTDKTSWVFQASIHLNHCTHGNFFFLPWHRAYLLYFEAICRAASGNPGFMLPYWNWTNDPQLPAPFWGDASNPLFNDTRVITQDDSADPEFVGPDVIQSILDTSDFVAFGSAQAFDDCSAPPLAQRAQCGYGILEGTPHNYIHGWIGGDMGTFLSPLDAIFWLHHANIDRLWTEWNKLFPNTDDADWLAFTFADDFFDIQGNPVSVQVNQMLDTYALGYRYDTQDPPAQQGGATALGGRKKLATYAMKGSSPAEAANAKAAGRTKALDVPVDLNDPLRAAMAAIASPTMPHAAGLAGAKKSVRLEVGGIEPPTGRVGVRVFVDCPYLKPTTPIQDPHYVGSFAFFEHGQAKGTAKGKTAAPAAGHAHGTTARSFLRDLGRTLRKLGRAKRYSGKGPLKLQMIVVPLDERAKKEPEKKVTPKKIRLSVVDPPK